MRHSTAMLSPENGKLTVYCWN